MSTVVYSTQPGTALKAHAEWPMGNVEDTMSSTTTPTTTPSLRKASSEAEHRITSRQKRVAASSQQRSREPGYEYYPQ